jgi:two-component system, chemotaxis family, sensor kinase CheA
VERLTLEPLGIPLTRLGEHARALSGRLNKGELIVHVDDGGLMGDPQRGAPLFATLIHLVRNAIDHGLETETARARAHKADPVLTLSSSEEGASLCIAVADNGRGIDWDRVRAAAEARGLSSGSHDALVEALFAATISTREAASEISGRGVGLAAVRTDVERLGGRIEVASVPGQGTTFRVRVPREALGVQGGDGQRGISHVPSVAAA